MMDCYAVLGVQEDASQDEIKRAFRERALECHPDRVDEEDEAAAREEFLRVREAFELLSDPQKRAAYDADDHEAPSGGEGASQEPVRRRSYETAWRRNQGDDREIRISQVLLDRVNGLSADYDRVRRRTSVTVPLCGLLGMLVYLYEPNAIYASDVFLVDLFLCTAIGGIYGFLIGSAWGYVDVYFQKQEDTSQH
jgi:hypothetical protein